MFAFGRGVGRPLSSATGASPYVQVSERLRQLGHHRKEGQTERAHCKEFASVVYAYASGFSSKSERPHKKTRSSPTMQPTESSVKAFVSVSTIDPASDDFLQSFEWRAVRMMALKKYGPVCQCCGASPKDGAVMNVDHIKPRKIFPQLALEVENLQVLCNPCNHGKGNWDMTDWRDDAGSLPRAVQQVERSKGQTQAQANTIHALRSIGTWANTQTLQRFGGNAASAAALVSRGVVERREKPGDFFGAPEYRLAQMKTPATTEAMTSAMNSVDLTT